MNITEMTEVMLAFDAGSTIQVRGAGNFGEWKDAVHPSWAWSACEYRVKPEPKPTIRMAIIEARDLLGDMTEAGGPYPEINGTELVRQANRVLSMIRSVIGANE